MPKHLARVSALVACLHLSAQPVDAQPAGASAGTVLHDVDVVTDKEYVRGTDAAVYAAVSGATDLTASHPLRGAEVVVSLGPKQPGQGKGRARELGRARTRADGTAAVRFAVPRDLALGDHVLLVHTRSRHGKGGYTRTVTVTDADMVHVRTDRGVYRPGHNLRWRVSAVNRVNAHPIANARIRVVIKDPSDNEIWRSVETTGVTGMVHGQIPLDRDIALGSYTVSARLDQSDDTKPRESSTTVQIKAYHMPAFTVAIKLDGQGPFAPGATVRGHVIARYLHGEPVMGEVALSGYGAQVAKSRGQLDKHGRMAFTATVREGGKRARIKARVTDGARRRHDGEVAVPLATHELKVAVIPERDTFMPGVRQWLTVITSDGHGNFAPAEVSLDTPATRRGSRASREAYASAGAVRIPFTPAKNSGTRRVRVRVTAKRGEVRAEETLSLRIKDRGQRFIRPHRAVVPGGDAIAISGTWKDRRGPLVATLLREGSPVASAPAQVDKNGRLSAHLQPPPGVFGLATIRVTEGFWDRDTGTLSPRHEQATVYLRPTALDVTIDGATRYRPGQTASLDIAVRDRIGRPLAGAGLAASVVDERVLAIKEPGPDLIAAVRALDTGRARAAGLAFADLMRAPSTNNRNLAMRALVEALPRDTSTPTVRIAAAARIRAEIARMGEVRARVYKTLLTDPRRIARRTGTGWQFADSLDRLLARGGWAKNRRETPWKNTIDWRYARRLTPDLTFDAVAVDIAHERLERLAKAVGKNERAFLRTPSATRLARAGTIPRYTAVDPWGTPVKIVRGLVENPDDVDDVDDSDDPDDKRARRRLFSAISAGPDGKFSTADDILRDDLLSIYGWGVGSGTGYSGFGLGGGGSSMPSIVTGTIRRVDREVAVRRRFDQTVLWETGLVTDENGRYTLEVPLADSITGWRVDVSALGPDGAMGQARKHLETALPTYLDVTLPHALTVGDIYQIPVIVANHSGADRTLLVKGRVAGSLEPTPGTAASANGPLGPGQRVTLPAGTTAMVPVSVRARAIGEGVLALSLSEPGGAKLDATRHTLQVLGPGHLERAIYTAEGRGDTLRIGFTIPDNHTVGSARAGVSLYRGLVDQAVDGLEGLLREPHGCFEQTSSTTYPNLLVLRLLRAGEAQKTDENTNENTNENTGETRKRARDLVARGYQRLISYEVTGGGFSWFGQAPANQVLTAYGLLEFVDMAAVYPVDSKLIDRTRSWLLKQQQSDGSWAPDKSWLHDWSAVQGKVSTTVYIAWALAESGYRGEPLRRAFRYLGKHRQALQEDPYLLSLWAAAASAGGTGANTALSALRRKVVRSGDKAHISAAGQTLFYAQGKGADIQVTALGATALARAPGRTDVAETLAWLWQARDARGGWGTTQGTVLALRAYAHGARQQAPGGKVRVRLGERVVGEVDLASLESGGPPGLQLAAGLPAGLPAGRHELSIEPVGERGSLDGVRVDVRTRWRTGPATHPVDSGLRVTVEHPGRPVRVGEELAMRLRLHNPGAATIALPTVVIPVPPGFRAAPASLSTLEQYPTIDRAEDQGTEIHLYLARLDAGQELQLDYRLEATAACEVTQRSAYGYAYYDPDTRGSSAELRLRALPRASK